MRRCYVYTISIDGVVRYVGKGTGSRLDIHLKRAQGIIRRRAAGQKVRSTHFYNRLAKALTSGALVEASVLVDNLTDDEAFKIETIEIASRDGLWNEWPGGFGAGFTSPRLIELFREKTRNSWTREAIRELRTINIRLATQTPENRARASEHAKRIWSDPATRANIMAGLERDQQRPEYIDDKRKAGRAGSREDKSRAGKLGSVNRSAQMRAVWASGKRKRAAPKRPPDRSARLREAWARRKALKSQPT